MVARVLTSYHLNTPRSRLSRQSFLDAEHDVKIGFFKQCCAYWCKRVTWTLPAAVAAVDADCCPAGNVQSSQRETQQKIKFLNTAKNEAPRFHIIKWNAHWSYFISQQRSIQWVFYESVGSHTFKDLNHHSWDSVKDISCSKNYGIEELQGLKLAKPHVTTVS